MTTAINNHETFIKTDKNKEKRYRDTIDKFQSLVKQGFRSFDEAGKELNIMFTILQEENPDWSVKRIAKQIWIDNEGLPGISLQTIYNHLNDTNKALIDTRFQNRKKVIEESGQSLDLILIEESSIYKEIEDSESQGKELTDEDKEDVASNTLRKDVYDYANERKLSADKKLMLTNSRLQKHPKLQESLINQLVTKTNKEAKVKVAQTIRDLETGALEKSGRSYIVRDSLREKIDLKGKVVKHPGMAYLDIIKSVHKLCEELTGHKLERSEFHYTEDHFKYTKEYRQEIIRNNNDKRSLIALINQLVLIADYADDFIEMINEMLNDIDRKPNLSE